jgi:hypothetical protein
MVHDEASIPGSTHVELDAVDPHGHCPRERVHGVLDRSTRCAAMGDDGGHRPILCIVGVVVSATITVTTITVTTITVTS